jgi:LysM repeat protein
VACASAAAIAGVASADVPVEHVVRPGETLASIAEQYYGDPRQESILVAENGLTNEGGSAIVTGLRLRIPTVSYHRVGDGETWASIATRYYGDPQRAFAIIEANDASSATRPDAGSELVIPYPLRHVATQHETVRQLAKDYLPSLKAGMNTIRRFNGFGSNRLQRGQIVLVPMAKLVLSEKARGLVEAGASGDAAAGKVRERQARIDAELPALREHLRAGRYADAVQLANRLVGGGDLSARQVVTIQRELATALVALDREDLAVESFKALLGQQPDYELDGVKTSPTVLRVFERARQQAAPTPPAGASAGAGGSGAAESAPPTEAAGTPTTAGEGTAVDEAPAETPRKTAAKRFARSRRKR